MGTSKVLVVCVFCILPLLAADCAAKPITIAPDDPLVGKWVSEEYDRTSEYNAKWVIFPDGRELDYYKIADTEPIEEVANVIEEKWDDSEGNHWYKIRSTWWVYPSKIGRTEGFSLNEINASGTTLESVYSGSVYPEELSPLGSFYRIFTKENELHPGAVQ